MIDAVMQSVWRATECAGYRSMQCTAHCATKSHRRLFEMLYATNLCQMWVSPRSQYNFR